MADKIHALYSSAQTVIDDLPSGNIWMDIVVNSIWIEMAYSKREEAFGVDIFDEDNPPIPFTGFDTVFDTFEDAEAYIFRTFASQRTFLPEQGV